MARARSATPVVRSRPVADHTDAVAVARDWLSGAGLVPTEQQVAELVPMARHWEPLARRVAISLVAAGQRPARQRVETFTRARITGRRQQAHATRAAIADFGARADQVAGWVAAHWHHHGHGPTWSELGHAHGLPARSQATAAIHALARDGWLTTGTTPRSLRPGPRHTGAAATAPAATAPAATGHD